jgi:hypothetical protein
MSSPYKTNSQKENLKACYPLNLTAQNKENPHLIFDTTHFTATAPGQGRNGGSSKDGSYNFKAKNTTVGTQDNIGKSYAAC